MTGRILVVDDIPANIRLLEVKLRGEFYEVLKAGNGEDALKIIEQQKPDLVLLDVMMPGMDGFTVCKKIKENPATTHVPVVMVTALSEIKDRVRGLEAGADDFLTKPVNDLALFSRVKSLLRLKMLIDEWRLRDGLSEQFGMEATAQSPLDGGRNADILIVDSQKIEADNITEILKGDEHRIIHVDNRETGQQKAITGEYDLIIINMASMERDALQLVSTLRATPATRQTPILLLAEEYEMPELARALEMGVNDYQMTPVDEGEIKARVRTQIRRRRYQERLRQTYEKSLTMALTDELTGLYNRRYFTTHMQEKFPIYKNSDRPLAVMMVDADHFKSVNDTYGHASGDDVLKELSKRMGDSVRDFDLVARIGGEEFVIVMPHTSVEETLRIGERVRAHVANTPFDIQGSDKPLLVTVSIGAAMITPADNTVDDLLARADQALYQAKQSGRNKVVLWQNKTP